MRRKNFFTVITACIVLIVFLIPSGSFAAASDVPENIHGYVGNSLDFEEKYEVFVTDCTDDEVFYEGDFCHPGTAEISYIDEYGDSGTSTVNVSYSPSLRLIADEWKYTGKYYYLYLYNISDRNVTFTNQTAKYIREGFAAANSSFRLTSKSVVVKPGAYKKLKFRKISGKVAYMPSINKAYMQIKCKMSGKTYTIKNVHGDVNFYKKSGGKWKFIDYRGDYDWF